MSLSAIIPIYNEPHVKTTISHLLDQKTVGDEIIAVNDANSSKEFTAGLTAFCEDKPVTLISGESTGASGNRMKGVEVATNDKIAFIDADCRPTHNWLGEMDKALGTADIVEGSVIYDSEDRCPLDRIIENRDTSHRFLTANMGVRNAVFEEVQFDERYRVFREDTDFGFTAVNNGFSTTFSTDCVVYHKEGRYSLIGFLKDQLRYVNEPLFYQKFQDDEKITVEVNALGPVLYPFELAALLTMALLLATPYSMVSVPLMSLILAGKYQLKKMEAQDCRFCPKNFLLLLILVPIALAVKRYAIWKGAWRFNALVI